MPTFETIAVAEAPKPTNKNVSSVVLAERAEYDEYLRTVIKTEKIGVLVPDGGPEKPSNVRMKLSHAARRLQVGLEMWMVDGRIYFKAAKKSQS